MKTLAAVLLALAIPSLSFGEILDPNFHMNLLITEPSYSGCDDPAFEWIDEANCQDLASTPISGLAYVWVVTSHDESFPDGLGGVQFGIEHTGVTVTGWTFCTGGSQIPEDGWPDSGHGNAVVWEYGCYEPPAENAKVGFFIVEDGAFGTMSIIDDPRLGYAVWANCQPISLTACDEALGGADLSVGTIPDCENSAVDPATNCAATDSECPVVVTWEHNGIDVTGFMIMRDGYVAGEADADARSFVDSSAVYGRTYEYWMVAQGACGSDPSNTDLGGVSPILPASECVASDWLCDVVDITWVDNSDNEGGFKVMRGGELIGTTGPDVTEFVDTTAEHGESYYYRIVATGICGDATWSNSDEGGRLVVPEAASDCDASDDECTHVLVTWQDNSDAESGFQVLRDGSPIGETDSSVTTYADSSGDAGVTYAYSVVAFNDCGDAPPSDPDDGTRDDAPPADPSDCSATDDFCGFVRVTWTDNSDDETHFIVMRDAAPIATIDANTTQYDDSTAAIGTAYLYDIIASGECGDSDPSNADSGEVGSDPPAAATNCAASDTLCGHIRVTWSDESDDEAGFRVFRDEEEIAVTVGDVTLFDDETAEFEVTYAYHVVSTSDCGDGAASNSDDGYRPYSPPADVPMLSAPPVGVDCVATSPTFEWHPAENATQYELQVSLGCSTEVVAQATTADTFATIQDLERITRHEWRVRAANVCGEWSDWSDCRAFLTTPQPLPATVMAEPHETGQGEYEWTFQWMPITNAEAYVLTVGFECYWYGYPPAVFTVAGTDTTIDLADYGFSDEFLAWVSGLACGARGDSSDCVGHSGGGVPVLLDQFIAVAADEGVILEWRTSGEHDLLGFNLYCRGSEEELDHRVNPELIQAGAGRTIYHDAGVRSQGTYIYRLTQLTTNGREIPLGELAVEFTPRPREISLLPNVPNPFNPTTSIAFTLPSTGHVVLDILDASGRRVRRLASGSHEAGVHRMIWDGTDDGGRPVASGTYFARLSAGGRSESRRLNLIR